MTDLTLVRAQGKLVALLGAMLEAAGVQTYSEFAGQLGLYAVAVADEEPEEGDILAYWAGMVRDMAPPGTLDPLTGKPFGRREAACQVIPLRGAFRKD